MSEQLEALRLADLYAERVYDYRRHASPETHHDMMVFRDAHEAEVRRLHAEIERLTKLCYDYIGELTALRAAKQMQERIDKLKKDARQRDLFQGEPPC